MDYLQDLDKLMEKVLSYNPGANIEMIKKAYAVAAEAHKEQARASGEPYIIHPLATAMILAETELDTDSIVAGILHDVIEDTDITYQDLKDQFGVAVADLVEGVTKLGRIPYSSKEEQQIENLRKMFLAMAKDIRVILIKLADRLHNMRTIGNVPPDKQRLKALETLEVYSPLAHRLGMSRIKSELEDISIGVLDPIGCAEVDKMIAQRTAANQGFVDSIKENIGQRLSEYNIAFTIQGRTKHRYSIYRKVYSQNRGFDEVYDFFAVRVIVDSVIDCYNVLGVIHDMYRPIPGRFKDYISTPKPNMYQSLHTTVIGSEGLIFEVQIRTWEMHKTAEYGIAAHWKYKAGVGGNNQDQKLSWIRQLLEIQRDSNDPEDFMRALKIDLFADEVFVFTPGGDVINLSQGCTVVDFAYAIHSAVGNRMQGAKVNGRIVTLDYVLKNGDVVEIITSGAASGPSLDWLKIAKSSQARSKIRQWFKREKRDENIERGKAELERELRKAGVSAEEFQNSDVLQGIYKKFHVNTLDDLYAGIGYGGIPLYNLMSRLDIERKKHLEELKAKDPEALQQKINQAKPRPKASQSGVEVEGIDNCLVKFARCCDPVPGDEIIGFITKGFGVSVHKKDCKNVAASMERDDERDRWIPVRWCVGENSTFVASLIIEGTDRAGVLADIINLVAGMHISMHHVSTREPGNGRFIISLGVEVQNADQVTTIMSRISSVRDVDSVKRARQ